MSGWGELRELEGFIDFFQSLLRVYFDSIYAYNSRFQQIENNLLVLFFSVLLTEPTVLPFRLFFAVISV